MSKQIRTGLILIASMLTRGAWATPTNEAPAPRPPTAVIFAAGYGGGHNRPAATMQAELEAKIPGIRVVILPAEKYLRGANLVPRVGTLSTTAFDTIYQRVPRLWNHIYDQNIAAADGKLSAGEIPYRSFSKRRILADLKTLEPDVIYSTFHIMTALLVGLRDDGLLNPRIPIAWLDTDFVNERFYALHSRDIDLTFIGHPALLEERVALGVPREKMVTTGLFVDPFALESFSEYERRAFVRSAMSTPDRPGVAEIWINGRAQPTEDPAVRLDPDVTLAVISSGRAGAGDYPTIVRGLVTEARARRQKIQIVAVCGDNEKMFDAVKNLYSWEPSDPATDGVTLVASRLVDHEKLLRLVRSAQLFIGKPGSLSAMEAATMGTPRVLMDIVGGQERWGAEFFARHDLAEKVDAAEQPVLAARAFAMLEDPDRMRRMRAADEVVRASYDLRPITDFFAKSLAERATKPTVIPRPAEPSPAESTSGTAPRQRTAVIFSASFGGGHDSSARSIRDKLLKEYPDLNVVILYAQDYIWGAAKFPIIARAATFAFDKIYQFLPKLWDRLFQQTINLAEGKDSAGDIPIHLFSTRRLLADLKTHRPDVIYSTYHLATSRLIALRERGDLNPEIPIAWLDTDFVQRPFFYLHSRGIEMTFIAHPVLRTERLALGVSAEKMTATGLFLNPFVFEAFSDDQRREFMRTAMSIPDQVEGQGPAVTKAPTRQIWINGRAQDVDAATLQLDPDVMTVTIASGRAGVGDYPAIVDGLIREARSRGRPIQIVTVCGDNRKNYRAVTRLYEKLAARGEADEVTLVVSRMVDNRKLMKLVRSSQLFIGKSGSQSPFEAAIMGVPRVLIDVIGGQERWTANFFQRLGLAEVVRGPDQGALAARAFAYLDDPARMAQMRAADQEIRDSYDLSPIPKFFEDAIAARPTTPPVEPPRAVRVEPRRYVVAAYCEDALLRVKRVFTREPPR